MFHRLGLFVSDGRFFLILRNEDSGELHQLIGKREQKRRVRQVKDRMENRYLHRCNVMGSKHRMKGKQDKRNHSEYHSPHHIKCQVDDGRSLCGSGPADTGYHGSHTGTDILSQRDENRRVRRYHTVHRQSL